MTDIETEEILEGPKVRYRAFLDCYYQDCTHTQVHASFDGRSNLCFWASRVCLICNDRSPKLLNLAELKKNRAYATDFGIDQ